MVGKFAVLLLVVCCSLQGYQARSVEPEPYNIIDDILKFIKNIKETCDAILKDLVDKIQQAIKDIDIPGRLEKIKKQIDEIISHVQGGANAVKECIQAEKASVEKLKTDVKNEMVQITDAAKSQGKEIIKAPLEILTSITDFLKQVIKELGACGIHPECIKEVIDKVKPKWEKMQSEISKTLDNARQAVVKVTETTIESIAEIAKQLDAQSQAIVKDFSDCCAEHTQQ